MQVGIFDTRRGAAQIITPGGGTACSNALGMYLLHVVVVM